MKQISNFPERNLSVLHLLHRAGQCADELFASEIGDIDLTPRQYQVMKTVSERKNPSQTTLVAQTGIDRSTLADIVKRLVERDLLNRERTPTDARKYAVSLTQKGQSLLELTTPTVRITNESLLNELPTESRDAFLLALERIVDALGSQSPAKLQKDTTPKAA